MNGQVVIGVQCVIVMEDAKSWINLWQRHRWGQYVVYKYVEECLSWIEYVATSGNNNNNINDDY